MEKAPLLCMMSQKRDAARPSSFPPSAGVPIVLPMAPGALACLGPEDSGCAILEWGPVSNQALRGFTPGDFLRPTPHDLASYFRLLQLDTCPVLSHVLHVSAPNMPRCGRNGQQPVQSLD